MNKKINYTQAWNYCLLEAILQALKNYLNFILNLEDYTNVFEAGKKGLILRPNEEEKQLLLPGGKYQDAIHLLSAWSGIPIQYLYGETQIATGLYIPPDTSLRFDNRLGDFRSFTELADIFDDPLSLDELPNSDYIQADHSIKILLEGLVFCMKREGCLPCVPALSERQNRSFGEPSLRLIRFADMLCNLLGFSLDLNSNTRASRVQSALSLIHWGKPFQKLVIHLAEATR